MATRPDVRAEELLAWAMESLPDPLGSHWSPAEVTASLAAYLSGWAAAELELDRPQLAGLVIALAHVCDASRLVSHHELGRPLGEPGHLVRRAYVRSGRAGQPQLAAGA